MKKQCKEVFPSRRFGIALLLWAINLFAPFLCVTGFAQSPDTLWTRTYGGTGSDEGHSVQETSDGGYIIAGWTSSFGAGEYDVYLIKTDVKGDTLWTRTYGGTGSDRGRSVQQTSDGGYIIAGCTESFGAGKEDVYLIKTDTNGDTLWTKTYGGDSIDIGFSVQQTSDGGYIIAGRTESFGAGEEDVYLVKTDAKGDLLWKGAYGGAKKDVGFSVQQTSDGGYIIAGWTESFGAGKEGVYLVKTDAKGDLLWKRAYGGAKEDLGFSVQETSDGGYIIAGYTSSFSAGEDVYLVKTDAKGKPFWTKIYGGTLYDKGYSVQETSDGGYIIAGWTNSFSKGRDAYLIKTDANGDSLWTRIYGGTSGEEGYLVQETSDGGCIVVGYTRSFGAGNKDIYLIKTVPSLKLTSPNGGEILVSNAIHHITWYPIGTYFDSYRLLYSLDGGESYPYIIADRISPNSGLYSWKVPEIECNTCRIKIQIQDMKGKVTEDDESDSNFTIQSTGIEEKESLPKTFFISLCDPNPFSQKTVISYQLPVKAVTSLKVYDVTGRIVKILTRTQHLEPGTYTLKWDGRNNSGERVSSGVYFLRFEACPVRPLVSYGTGGYNATRKLLMMR